MEHESDKGEFVFALMLNLFGLLPITGLASGLMYDDSIWNSSFWILVNFILLALAIKLELILVRYTLKVYRREFNGFQDIIRTIRSVWLEIKEQAKNA